MFTLQNDRVIRRAFRRRKNIRCRCADSRATGHQRHVCTNIELLWEPIKQYVADKWEVHLEDDKFIPLSERHIGLFHQFTPSGTAKRPVLVVIDEAHLVFNARDFAHTDKNFRETLVFLTQSRKVHTDVIFISQSILNMDRQFMRLMQYIWRFRDLSRWKIPLIGIHYPFQQMLAIQYDYDGHTILQKNIVRKDTRIFGLYETNALLRPFPRLEGIATERKLKKVTKEKNHMMKWVVLTIAICLLIGVYFGYQKVKKGYSGDKSRSARNVNTTEIGHVKATDREPIVSTDVAAYLIYQESFVGWNGPNRTLQTNQGWYQLGEMSNHGYVVAVSKDRAKVATPDGHTAWVLSDGPTVAAVSTQTPEPFEAGEVHHESERVHHDLGSSEMPVATPIQVQPATRTIYRNGRIITSPVETNSPVMSHHNYP